MPPKLYQTHLKRLLDIAFSLLVIWVGLLFLPAIALLIKVASRGNVFYVHERLSKDGQPFNAIKFRTMRPDADQRLADYFIKNPNARLEYADTFKLKNDPRIIAGAGRFLRKTSLDELPQFINVLKGEMSVVGPRPIVEEEKAKYGRFYEKLASVKPGITGLWQVSGRSETNYRERVAYDTYYLQSWSVWLDLWILLNTFGAVIKGKGAY